MSDEIEDFNLSVVPVVFGPFTLDTVNGKKSFVLKEATEDVHIAYKDASLRGMRAVESPDGKRIASVVSGSDADSVLLAGCLFERLLSKDGTQTTDVKQPLEFVRAQPRRVTVKLIKKVKEISGIKEDEETEEFLSKRIEADKKKLEALQKKAPPPADGPSSITPTSE